MKSRFMRMLTTALIFTLIASSFSAFAISAAVGDSYSAYNAKFDLDDDRKVNVSDVTTLLDYLANPGSFPGVDIVEGEIRLDDLFDVTYSSNLLDDSTIGRGMITKDGKIHTSEYYSENFVYFGNYIPVTPGDRLSLQYTLNGERVRSEDEKGDTGYFARICMYDANKKTVDAGSGSYYRKFTVPDGVYFVRVTLRMVDYMKMQDIAVVKNAAGILPYERFGQITRKIKNEYLPEEYTSELPVYLPPEICVAVGRTVEIYNEQVCPAGGRYHFRWSCAAGRAVDRKFTVTGTPDNVGEYQLLLSIYDDGLNILYSNSTTLKIVDTLQEEMTVLTIGDSLTNWKPWLPELINLSGSKIKTVGTRVHSLADANGIKRTFRHEGRSGWSAKRYTQPGDALPDDSAFKYANPFYFKGDFDYSYYVENSLDGQYPDAVILFLGTNAIDADPTDNANAIAHLVDRIREADGNAKIFVVNTLYPADQNGIGTQKSDDGYTQTGDGKFKYLEDLKVFRLMVRLHELLDGREGVFFAPVALCHDSKYNFGAVETPVNPRAEQTEYIPADSVHPKKQGYYQFADVIFSAICAHTGEE